MTSTDTGTVYFHANGLVPSRSGTFRLTVRAAPCVHGGSNASAPECDVTLVSVPEYNRACVRSALIRL